MIVSFDQLFEGLDQRPDVLHITPSVSGDFSKSELKITRNISLIFSDIGEQVCKSITIADGAIVNICKLSLRGSITVKKGSLKLLESSIYNPPDGCDYLLAALDHSNVDIKDCFLRNTEHFGLCADDHSSVNVESSSIEFCKLFPVVLSSFSIFNAYDSKFSKSESDLIYADTDCTIQMWRCTLKNTTRLGISAGSRCSIDLTYCRVRKCESGAMSTVGCDRVDIEECTISDIPHTAILFEQTTALVKNSKINQCNGNAINASRNSKVVLCNNNFWNTTYPPVALCEHSVGYLHDCSIIGSQMSGVIVRSGSKAYLHKCVIQFAKQCGVVISDSDEVKLKECIIVECRESSVMAYNHSKAEIKSCILIGPGKTGINVFTGGFVESSDTIISGMERESVWAHHGGSANLSMMMIQTDPVENQKKKQNQKHNHHHKIEDGNKIISNYITEDKNDNDDENDDDKNDNNDDDDLTLDEIEDSISNDDYSKLRNSKVIKKMLKKSANADVFSMRQNQTEDHQSQSQSQNDYLDQGTNDFLDEDEDDNNGDLSSSFSSNSSASSLSSSSSSSSSSSANTNILFDYDAENIVDNFILSENNQKENFQANNNNSIKEIIEFNAPTSVFVNTVTNIQTTCKIPTNERNFNDNINNNNNNNNIKDVSNYLSLESTNKIKRVSFSQIANKDKIYRIETERQFISTHSIASGKRIPDVHMNIGVENAISGVNATHPQCKICSKDASGCHFSACSHCLYCKECWDNLEKKPKSCELCLMPIEKMVYPIDCSHENEENICGICLEGKVDTVIVPCGHTICFECAEHWFSDNLESGCPFCREPGSKHRKYVSYS